LPPSPLAAPLNEDNIINTTSLNRNYQRFASCKAPSVNSTMCVELQANTNPGQAAAVDAAQTDGRAGRTDRRTDTRPLHRHWTAATATTNYGGSGRTETRK